MGTPEAMLDTEAVLELTSGEGWERLVRGYRLAGLLLSAHRLGLLSVLNEQGPQRADELGTALNADVELTRACCRALEAADVCRREADGAWSLTPSGQWLAAQPAARLELDALADDYHAWGRLDKRARALASADSSPVVSNGAAGDRSDVDDIATDQAAARRYGSRLAARHREQFEHLVDALEPSRAVHVLDVGGGEGQLARTIVRRWPDATCTIVEVPAMAAVAAERCAGEERITVRPAHFFSTPEDGDEVLPRSADVVIVSHILDSLRQTDQRQLSLRTAKVLAPGGCMVSCEAVLHHDSRHSLDVLLSMVGQAVQRREGHLLTMHEQDTLLRAAGLAAADEWWVAPDVRAVLGVRPTAGVEPALRVIRPAEPSATW
ncbi:MAG: methyltransferase [Egibacteraceae bacterium]